MNDHIPDVTKMISDTPRTDAAEYESQDEPVAKLGSVDVDFARQLKRELNEIERLAAVRLSYIKLIEAQNDAANDRIKRLEEELMDTKNKHAVLVADVVLNEDRAERIKRLEEAGDAVAAIIGPPGSAHWADENQVDAAWNNWTKAKEAKP